MMGEGPMDGVDSRLCVIDFDFRAVPEDISELEKSHMHREKRAKKTNDLLSINQPSSL